MENPAKPLSIALIALVIGLGGGYVLGQRSMPMVQAPVMGNVAMDQGTMATTMGDMNATLRGKTGADFDKVFLDEMIVHHQGAVDMAKLALVLSSRAELKTFANEIITAQTREMGQMRAWRGTWFK